MSGGPGMGGLPSPYNQALSQANWMHAQTGLQNALAQQHIQMAQQVMQSQMMPAISAQSVLAGASMQLQAGRSMSTFAQTLMKPDPAQPDTLGWREWSWSDADKMLKSPSQGTLWPEAELVVPHWDDGEAVRGVSGIHAHLVPKHWKIICCHHGEYVPSDNPMRVHGIVERFGRYVLGTEGWRAEWVVIRELMAPSTKVGLAIEQAYPDVIVHYPEEEGDITCTSEKSSKLGKGNRSTSRPKPSQSFSQPQSPSSSPASPPLIQTKANPSVSQPMLPSDLGLSQSESENLSPSSLLSAGEKRFLFNFVLFFALITLIGWLA